MLQNCKDTEKNCLFKQTEMFLQDIFTIDLTHELVIGAFFFMEKLVFVTALCMFPQNL